MNPEQYRQWLKENGNQEEANALGVVDVLVRYHTAGTNFRLTELHPHLWVEGEGERFEIDLLIKLESERKYYGHTIRGERKIAVEFKEGDIKRVIAQAVVRRPYVDYVYIATRKWVDLDYYDLFVMGYYGLGWVVWDEDFAKIIVPSKWRYPAHALEYLVEDALQRHLNKVMAKMKGSMKEKDLFEFLGVKA